MLGIFQYIRRFSIRYRVSMQKRWTRIQTFGVFLAVVCICWYSSLIREGRTLTGKMARDIPNPSGEIGRVLILTWETETLTSQTVITAMEHFHFGYELFVDLPRARLKAGYYDLIVMPDFMSYMRMHPADRAFLTTYCKRNGIGLISFVTFRDSLKMALNDLKWPLSMYSITNITQVNFVATDSEMWRITRPSSQPLTEGLIPDIGWTGFDLNHPTYQPIYTVNATQVSNSNTSQHIAAVLDTGENDGVKRVLMAYGVKFWLNNYIFIDAIDYLTNGKLRVSRDRHIAIEIDDVLRGDVRSASGMNTSDIDAIVDLQDDIKNNYMPEFQFGLGINAQEFSRNSQSLTEMESNRYLLEKSKLFRWYDHTFNHANLTEQPYASNSSFVITIIQKNRDFAKENEIPISEDYVVTMAHTGVYPTLQSVYEAFLKLGVTITGADRYYKYNRFTARRRAGFVHKGVHVIPRIEIADLLCNLIRFDQVKGGKHWITVKLFLKFLPAILYNPVAIHFSHYRNFAGDRLGYYVVKKGLDMIQEWTNLRLHYGSPPELVDKYFEYYPEDKQALWQHPCAWSHLRFLKAGSRVCEHLPTALIVGPEQTGSDILAWMLRLHSGVLFPNRTIDFFIENYHEGINWYASMFPETDLANKKLFDMSESYFSQDQLPLRAANLLPDALVFITLSDPVTRAFAVYKAAREADSSLSSVTFLELLTNKTVPNNKILQLRIACLEPGIYIRHIRKWLDHFKQNQIVIIEGDTIRTDPGPTMTGIQQNLQIWPVIEYTSMVKLSETGDLCLAFGPDNCIKIKPQVEETEFTPQARQFLTDYYKESNNELLSYLRSQGLAVPEWLSAVKNVFPVL